MRLDISLRGHNPGDVLKFGFGRDVPPRNLKVDPYNTNFSRKSDPFMYQLVQFVAKFWAKSPDFSKFFLNLSQFWLKFGELLKNQPIHIPILHFIRGHSYTKRLILLPMLATHPRRVFCIKYPPPGHNWVHCSHRPQCTVTLNSNFAILKTWNCFQLD